MFVSNTLFMKLLFYNFILNQKAKLLMYCDYNARMI